MGINWAEKSVLDYALGNGLKSELKSIFQSGGYKDKENKSFEGFEFECLEINGGEGEGEEYSMVFEITYPDAHKEFWRLELSYYSYHGVEWDGWSENCYEVEKKLITREAWVAK